MAPPKLYKLQTPQNLATLLILPQILSVSRGMQQVAWKHVQVTKWAACISQHH